MKTHGNKTGGIILILLGASLAALFSGIAIYNIVTMFDTPTSSWPPDPYAGPSENMDMMKGALAFGMLFLAMCSVPLIVVGAITLKRGNANQKVIMEGRTSSCVIEDLRSHRFKSGWHFIMVVSYKDDNGNYQRYSTQIPRDRYQELKVGMTLECLVRGNECYIDIMNTKVIDNQVD